MPMAEQPESSTTNAKRLTQNAKILSLSALVVERSAFSVWKGIGNKVAEISDK